MTKEEITKKNLDLHSEFLRYTFENPEILDKIPKGATLVILPEDDEELYSENMKIVEDRKEKELPVVVIRMKIPKPTTPTMELVNAK